MNIILLVMASLQLLGFNAVGIIILLSSHLSPFNLLLQAIYLLQGTISTYKKKYSCNTSNQDLKMQNL